MYYERRSVSELGTLKSDFQSGSHSMSRSGYSYSSPLKVHLALSMAAESAKNGLLMDFCIGTSGVDFFLDVICLDFIARQR